MTSQSDCSELHNLSLAIANYTNGSYFVLSLCDVIILITSLNFVAQRLAFDTVSVLAQPQVTIYLTDDAFNVKAKSFIKMFTSILGLLIVLKINNKHETLLFKYEKIMQ